MAATNTFGFPDNDSSQPFTEDFYSGVGNLNSDPTAAAATSSSVGSVSPVYPSTSSPYSEDNSLSESSPFPNESIRSTDRASHPSQAWAEHYETEGNYNYGGRYSLPVGQLNVNASRYGEHVAEPVAGAKRLKSGEGQYIATPGYQSMPSGPGQMQQQPSYQSQMSYHYPQYAQGQAYPHQYGQQYNYRSMPMAHPGQLDPSTRVQAGPLDGMYMSNMPVDTNVTMSVHPQEEIARSRTAAMAVAQNPRAQQMPYAYIGGDDVVQLQSLSQSSTSNRSRSAVSSGPSTPSGPAPAAGSGKKRTRNPSPEPSWHLDDEPLNKNAIIPVKPGVTITAEELISLSPQDLEDYIKSNALSSEQEVQLKKQRRLMKNRESAQVSRLKKKRYVEELEDKVNQLAERADALTKQLEELKNENEQLQKELYSYKMPGGMQPDIEMMRPKFSMGSSGSGPVPPGRSGGSFMGGDPRVPQIYLLAILFAFGLFISSPDSQQSMIFPHREFSTFTKLPLTDPYVVRRLQSLPYLADNAAQLNSSSVDRGGAASSTTRHGVFVHCSPSNIESTGDQMSVEMLREIAANPDKVQSALSIAYSLQNDKVTGEGAGKEQKVQVTCNVVNSKVYIR